MVYSMTAASSGASVRPTNYSASNLPITDLGAPTDNTDAATKKYVDDQVSGMVTDVQVNNTSIVSNGVANIPAASVDGYGFTRYANQTQIKTGNATNRSNNVAYQHIATFYGLAKAARDTTQSQSSNAVGTYTPEAQAAIQNMLGISQTGLSVVNGQLCITYEEVSA